MKNKEKFQLFDRITVVLSLGVLHHIFKKEFGEIFMNTLFFYLFYKLECEERQKGGESFCRGEEK